MTDLSDLVRHLFWHEAESAVWIWGTTGTSRLIAEWADAAGDAARFVHLDGDPAAGLRQAEASFAGIPTFCVFDRPDGLTEAEAEALAATLPGLDSGRAYGVFGCRVPPPGVLGRLVESGDLRVVDADLGIGEDDLPEPLELGEGATLPSMALRSMRADER